MTKEELIAALKALDALDPERAHSEADSLLIEFIADEEIESAFFNVERWYA